MSILLIGSGGQVGQELVKTLADLSPQLGPLKTTDRSQLDLTDLGAIDVTISNLSPQLIVNAAAYTAVDKAESEPDLARRINADAPGAMAKAAKACGAKLVHISTDYVFSGQESTPRKETDPTGPLSVYGQTKLAGEEAIRAVLEEHIILRTAWVYGTYGTGNFVKTMLRLGSERSELSVVADQIGTPTWARDIATAIAQLSQQICTADAPTGTFHYTNSQGPTSWHAFATEIFDRARALGLPLQIETVNSITTAEYPTPAQRPPYSVLNCAKVTDALGHPPPAWQESLQAMLQEYIPTLISQSSAPASV